MELFVDPTDARSLTSQLYEQLRGAIVEGRPAPKRRAARPFHRKRRARRAAPLERTPR